MRSLLRGGSRVTRFRWVCVGILALAGGSCSTPNEPSPPLSGPPVLACPIQQIVPSNGAGVTVTYPAPTVTGGTPPVSAPECTPASGSTFPIGTTTVQCSVQDAQARSASCSFGVSVTAPPKLQKTRFLAFGDSLTEGSLSLCGGLAPGLRGPTFFRDDARLVRSAVFNAFSYPSQLQILLQGWYTAQMPIVINEGYGGETVGETMFSGEDQTAIERLPGVLSLHDPEVLLLMHGINDIHQGTPPAQLVDGLEVMVEEAKGRDIVVYLGTLLPQRIDACRNYAVASDIQETNSRIKLMGLVQGVRVVDLYAAFIGQEDTLLGPDGLHPNEAGYRAMAETFFNQLKATFEVPSIIATAASSPPGPLGSAEDEHARVIEQAE